MCVRMFVCLFIYLFIDRRLFVTCVSPTVDQTQANSVIQFFPLDTKLLEIPMRTLTYITNA